MLTALLASPVPLLAVLVCRMAELAALKRFVEQLKRQPNDLNKPELKYEAGRAARTRRGSACKRAGAAGGESGSRT